MAYLFATIASRKEFDSAGRQKICGLKSDNTIFKRNSKNFSILCVIVGLVLLSFIISQTAHFICRYQRIEAFHLFV